MDKFIIETNEETKCRSFHDQSIISLLSNRLKQFYLSEEYCDATIVTFNGIIKAHRIVLSALSSFFESCFSPLWESQGDKSVQVPFDFTTMKLIIDFMYTGCVEITEDNIMTLLEAQDYFQIGSLRTYLSYYIVQALTFNNIGMFIKETERFRYSAVNENAWLFLKGNFRSFILTEAFFSFDYDLLSKCLRSEFLEAPAGEIILKKLCEWTTKNDISEEAFISLLNLCDPSMVYSWDRTKSDCLMSLQEMNSKHLKAASDWFQRATSLRFRALGTESLKYKTSIANVFVSIGGLNTNMEPVRAVNCILSYENNWGPVISLTKGIPLSSPIPSRVPRILRAMSIPRRCPAVANEGDHIYVAGGDSGGDTVEMYSIQGNEWTDMPSLKNVMCLAALNGDLYAVDDSHLWVLNFGSIIWKKLNKFPFDQKECFLVACDSLYTLGSKIKYNPSGSKEYLYRYDLILNIWNPVCATPEKFSFLGCVSLGDKLFFGAEDGSYCYDIINNEWSFDKSDDSKFDLPLSNEPQRFSKHRRRCYGVEWKNNIVIADYSDVPKLRIWRKETGIASKWDLGLPCAESALVSILLPLHDPPPH